MARQAGRVALIVAIGTSAGTNVGKVPISLPVLSETFGLSLFQASLTISLFLLAAMLVGIVGGMLADRFGPRRVMALGLLVSAAGGLIGAASSSGAMLLASRALESFGFIATVLPGPALLSRLVSGHRLRPVMGLWACYMPLGMSMALALGPWLLDSIGWRGIWVALALVSGGLALAAWRLLPPDPGATQDLRARALVMQTVGSRKPWLLAGTFAVYAGQWMSVFGFLPTLYAEQGVPAAAAGLLTALGAGINVTGNLGAGLLMQGGWRRHRLLIFASTTMLATAWIIFASAGPFALRYAAVLAFSAAGGLIPGALFASTPAFAPSRSTVSTTTGLMQQGSALGQFIAPPVIALLVSATGNWSVTWLVTGALACMGIVLALLIRREG